MSDWEYTEAQAQSNYELAGICKMGMAGQIPLEKLEEILKGITEGAPKMLPAQTNINGCFVTFSEVQNEEGVEATLPEFGAVFKEFPPEEVLKEVYPNFTAAMEIMERYHFVFAQVYSTLDIDGAAEVRYRGSCWPITEHDMDVAQERFWNINEELRDRIDAQTIAALRLLGMDKEADDYENNTNREKVILVNQDGKEFVGVTTIAQADAINGVSNGEH